MKKPADARKVFEVAYRNEDGEFCQELCFAQEVVITKRNIEEDYCTLLYVREADPNDIATMIKLADGLELERMIRLASRELSNRLLSYEVRDYK